MRPSFASLVASLLVVVAALVVLLVPAPARACGCFAPPRVITSKPVIQAGERIVFSVEQGVVTAHIQVAYSGDAADFAWLLPLPSLPTLELGTEDLFRALENATAPTFSFAFGSATCTESVRSWCNAFGSGGAPAFTGDLGMRAPPSPAVVVDSLGPYDYAVLKADDNRALVEWLTDNRYGIPPGGDAAIAPYIHAGGYFLALKLKSGKSTGELRPVVVRYATDLPMIPLVLTSTGAVPDMHVLVWLLGAGRAIPRNYHHAVVNLAALDWQRAATAYGPLLTRAVREAPEHHAFVTEFAGPATLMRGAIPVPTFDAAEASALTDPLDFASYFQKHFRPPFDPVLRAVLRTHLPEPAELRINGLSEVAFYADLRRHLVAWLVDHPDYPFDAAALSAALDKEIVIPQRAAAALFEGNRYLTRLHTVMSPADMTADPAFSFTSALPDVSNQHFANVNFDCDGNRTLALDGRTLPYPAPAGTPAAQRIERLREEGAPEVLIDNAGGLGGGCAVRPAPEAPRWPAFVLLVGAALLAVRLRPLGRR